MDAWMGGMGESTAPRVLCGGGDTSTNELQGWACDLAHGQVTRDLETQQCLFLALDTALELKI